MGEATARARARALGACVTFASRARATLSSPSPSLSPGAAEHHISHVAEGLSRFGAHANGDARSRSPRQLQPSAERERNNVTVAVQIEPAASVPAVEYRWDADTDILTARLRGANGRAGMSGSVELEGSGRLLADPRRRVGLHRRRGGRGLARRPQAARARAAGGGRCARRRTVAGRRTAWRRSRWRRVSSPRRTTRSE